MSIDHAILAVISARPCSGYDLKVEFEHEGRTMVWAMSYGSIYNRLQELERQGLIETYQVDTEGRQKKMYELTGKGWEELNNWLAQPPEYPVVKDELLLKIGAWGQGRPGDHKTLVEHLLLRKIRSQQLLQYFTWWPQNGYSCMDGYDMLIIEYVQSRLKAELEWIDAAVKKLEGPPPAPAQDPFGLIPQQRRRREHALAKLKSAVAPAKTERTDPRVNPGAY